MKDDALDNLYKANSLTNVLRHYCANEEEGIGYLLDVDNMLRSISDLIGKAVIDLDESHIVTKENNIHAQTH